MDFSNILHKKASMVLKLLFMYTDRRRVTGRRTDRKMDRT
jgi:hypothetical protein